MRKAYTLVEVLVVLLIFAVITGIGVINYRDFNRRQQVVGAARQMKADIRLAQTEALAGKKPTSGAVSCDTPGSVLNSYSVVRVSSTSYRVEANCVNPSRIVAVRTVTTPPNTTIDDFATISFKPLGDGTSIPAGTSVTITIRGSGTSFLQTITINAAGDIL